MLFCNNAEDASATVFSNTTVCGGTCAAIDGVYSKEMEIKIRVMR